MHQIKPATGSGSALMSSPKANWGPSTGWKSKAGAPAVPFALVSEGDNTRADEVLCVRFVSTTPGLLPAGKAALIFTMTAPWVAPSTVQLSTSPFTWPWGWGSEGGYFSLDPASTKMRSWCCQVSLLLMRNRGPEKKGLAQGTLQATGRIDKELGLAEAGHLLSIAAPCLLGCFCLGSQPGKRALVHAA